MSSNSSPIQVMVQVMVQRMTAQMAKQWGLWLAHEVIGFNDKLEHLVLSSDKITPEIEDWLNEKVGHCSRDWDWMHYPGQPGSIYAFREENKAILFKLAGFG